MNRINLVRKLTSRKFWMSVASFVSMMIMANGGTENQAAQVAALILAGATAIAYVVGEGLTDSFNSASDVDISTAIEVTEKEEQ